MKPKVSIKQLFNDMGKDLDMKLIAGESGMDKTVLTSEVNRPGLALAGYFDTFSFDRIQILGLTETSYFKDLPPEVKKSRLQKFFSYDIPCIIVTTGLHVPEDIIELSEQKSVPLLTTSIQTSRFQGRLLYYLEKYFAPHQTKHGSLLDVYGMGVLITGDSGVGKSECALELVQRGHRLVADDMVILRRLSKEVIVGKSPESTRFHMELRGVGIVDILSLYGISAVRDEKKVSLIIKMDRWQNDIQYERLGIDSHTAAIFDVEIPEYVIPVEPGRNMSIIVEAAALNQKLKYAGINVAEKLNANLINIMKKK